MDSLPPVSTPAPSCVAVIGGGPAGLMAAEVLARHGVAVTVYDAMASIGRKFLLAGKGGLNLSHAEDPALFLSRYGERTAWLAPLLQDFGAVQLRAWAGELGVETFVGSSGRIFPVSMKAAPLLRAWQHRLRSMGVRFEMRHRWTGWNAAGEICFDTPAGTLAIQPTALLLALGGGSWARLGSTGAWVSLLQQRGIRIAPLQAANCGFEVNWSPFFRDRFAGQPVKNIAMASSAGPFVRGEMLVSDYGVEGSLVYALSARLRKELGTDNTATLRVDLLPERNADQVLAETSRPRGSRSLASHLQGRLGLQGIKAGLLRENTTRADLADPVRLALAIKALPLRITASRPLDEAISSAGGVPFEELDAALMLKALPGVFCAGEMLDWEAPTGGYLLTASMATGLAAGQGACDWLHRETKLFHIKI